MTLAPYLAAWAIECDAADARVALEAAGWDARDLTQEQIVAICTEMSGSGPTPGSRSQSLSWSHSWSQSWSWSRSRSWSHSWSQSWSWSQSRSWSGSQSWSE